MLYKLSRSVPKSTTELSPDWQKLKIGRGTLMQWLIQMPEEAADLLQFRVEYHGTQILPFTGKQWIYGLFEPTLISENLLIIDKPYTLDVFAKNSDDSYPHEYNLYANIIPEKPVVPGVISPSVLERFRNLFGGGV